MLTTLYEDLVAVDDLARTFAARELAGRGAAHDRDPLGPSLGGVVDKAFEAGFLAMMLPPEPEQGEVAGRGVPGAGLAALCLVLGRLCRADASLGALVFESAWVQALLGAAGAGSLLAELGAAPSVREALVAWPVYADPSRLPALPEARPDEDGGGAYLLSGRVELLVPGPLAARALLPARLSGERTWSLFLLDLKGSGVTLSPPVLTLGLQGCPAADLTLAGARARLVGEAGQGARAFARAAGLLHVAAGAMNAGILEGAFEDALAYARERIQGGRRIADWSALRMILGELRVKSDAARLCVQGACLSLLHGVEGAERRALAAALHVHALACEGVTDGIQILGGYGYMKDYPQEKRFRDARQVRALLGLGPESKLGLVEEAP